MCWDPIIRPYIPIDVLGQLHNLVGPWAGFSKPMKLGCGAWGLGSRGMYIWSYYRVSALGFRASLGSSYEYGIFFSINLVHVHM